MKNMILLAWTVAAVLILSAFNMPAHAAVTEAWVHRYSNVVSNLTTEVVKVVIDSAGDVIVIGDVQQTGFIVIIKYSGADGSVSWRQRYRSAGSYKFDQVKDVGVDGDWGLQVIDVSDPHIRGG